MFCDGDWVESKDQNAEGEIRLIQLADVGDGIFKDRSNRHLTLQKAFELGCTFLNYGDILIARMPEPLGRACIFPLKWMQKYVTVVDVAILRIDSVIADNHYVCHMVNSPQSRSAIDKLESGTTRKRISRKNLETISFPLPPLPEQHRIVAKIEELFSELDKGVESLKTAQEQLKIYRQAVLQRAFEGICGNNDIENSIRNISIFVTSGSRGWAQYYSETGARFIRIGNLTRDTIFLELSDVQRLSLPTNAEGVRSRLKPEDILISITADIGSVAVVPADIGEAYINQHIAVVRLHETGYSKYVAYYLKSEDGRRKLLKHERGATKKGIGLDDIRDISLPIPNKTVVDDVVAEIESRLSVCDKLEESISQSLLQAEALRQSILKKAFEGKLVPQDPQDEPAEKLLARIRAERAQTQPAQKVAKGRKKK